jgi:hypothetical protein
VNQRRNPSPSTWRALRISLSMDTPPFFSSILQFVQRGQVNDAR